MAGARLPTLLLPGLDGSGRLFGPLLAAGPRGLAPRVVPLPADRPRSYDEYLDGLRGALPRRGSWALLAESFSGPLAVRLAAERPRGLQALVLVATFLHRPLHPRLRPLAPLVGPALFSLPLLPATVRLLLVGWDAPDGLVRLTRQATAAVPAEILAGRAQEALRADVRRELGATELPLLFLAPAGDRLLRTDSVDEVIRIRPDAQAARLDGPHAILQARPQACLERIEPFLAGGRGAGRGRGARMARPVRVARAARPARVARRRA